MLSHLIQDLQGAKVIKFQGSLDALTVPEVRPEMEALLDKGKAKIVVDLAQVATIDSTGIALIVSLYKRMRAVGGQLRIAGLQGQPREVFHFLKLDQSLPMAATVDEALAGF